ncbi:C-type lectin domain family 4 member G-like isoform X2 [Poecilia formosa]|nr:PREDICTED: C-type lectin domain family 4 member G-like isoform X2 [Poecilia formosa]
MRAAPGHTFSSISQLFQLAAYWMILLVVIPLHIHLHISVDFELNQLKTKEAALIEKIQNLTTELDQVKKINQELQTEKKNLTEQIESMKKTWNEQNVSQAQWIIDQYCPKDKNRQCVSCQKGWLHSQSSCYAVNNVEPKNQKTWEEARENCRGKSSDLTVVGNEEEKTFLKGNSWVDKNIKGYWIGLRAEGGRWKWIDGSDLTNQAWIQQPATDGRCVTSLQNREWKSVSCTDKNAWFCEKKALSV